jgi:hypothetical protein
LGYGINSPGIEFRFQGRARDLFISSPKMYLSHPQKFIYLFPKNLFISSPKISVLLTLPPKLLFNGY